MMKFIIILMVLLFSSAHSFADETHIKDGTTTMSAVVKVADTNNKDQPQELKKIELYTFPDSGFHDSTLRIGLIIGGYMINPWGEMVWKEKQIHKAYRYNIPSTIIGDISYTGQYKGCEVDYLLPSIKYFQQGQLNLTGIKFGIRGRYSYPTIKEGTIGYIYENNGLNSIYKSTGGLLKYNSWQLGPVVNVIFSPQSNVFNAVIHSYILFGYVSHGKLDAAPALRDAGVLPGLSKDYYYTKFNGYSLSIGLGPHFVLNKWVPVTIGFNINYTFTKMYFDRSVPLYDNDKETSFNDLAIELSFGVHI